MRFLISRTAAPRICRFVVALSACAVVGCDANPGGPAAPASIPAATDAAPAIKAGQTPAGLAKGTAFKKGGVTVTRKSAIKTAAPANGSL